jgi:hypothetical protein
MSDRNVSLTLAGGQTSRSCKLDLARRLFAGQAAYSQNGSSPACASIPALSLICCGHTLHPCAMKGADHQTLSTCPTLVLQTPVCEARKGPLCADCTNHDEISRNFGSTRYTPRSRHQ